MRQKPYRFIALLAVFAVSLILPIMQPVVVSAAEYSSDSIENRAKAIVLALAVAECIDEEGFNDENESGSDMEKGQWLQGDGTNGGEWSADLAEPDDSDGKGSNDADASCEKIAVAALNQIGWEATDALCKMGDIAGKTIWERDDDDDSCTDGTGDYDFDEGLGYSKSAGIWEDFFREVYLGGQGIGDSTTDGIRYLIYSENFYQECSKDHGAGWSTPREWQSGDTQDDDTYKLRWNKLGTTPDKEWRVSSTEGTRDRKVHIDGDGLSGILGDHVSCDQLEESINNHAEGYLEEIANNPNDDDDDDRIGDSENTDPSCDSEGGSLAWFMCAVIGDIIDGAINFLDEQIHSLLFIDGDRIDDENIDKAWGTMRNIALLILVPMMMFMVIGTALNFGPFDPYTVKKALPRMMVAVIFIVLSLFITRFAVQLSNVVGQGIGNIIIAASPTDDVTIAKILEDNAGIAAGAGFAGLVATWGAYSTGALTIGIIASFAIVVVLALLIAFVILVMRQVLIITLMVVAPLAILVWIFPGNDKLWALWKSTFIAMLLLYPIIAVLIASGKFVAGLFGS